ncbi:helix-turn-helix domain-containing protein [Burkholderia cenocepacia]|uniref:helix-turn-helix transcriptional regulator n=1 Tax=Burkholderia cenocepacia TaxID=95486 RepID=UPI0022311007|nr:helix-turn-helix transcriptional regulator [Burkholderia cenocepacia]MCW3657568.1 helix-turn-helix domain-containing protein [Burkholderia cenocepacia]
MALGQNIKALRTLLGTSRPELATAIGLDPQKGQQRIYALEERDSSKSDLAPALATHFGVSLRALIEDDLSGIDRDAYSQMVKDTQDGLHTLVEEVGDVLGNAVRNLSPGTMKLVKELMDAEYSGELTVEIVNALQQVLDMGLQLKRKLNDADADRDIEHVKHLTG